MATAGESGERVRVSKTKGVPATTPVTPARAGTEERSLNRSYCPAWTSYSWLLSCARGHIGCLRDADVAAEAGPSLGQTSQRARRGHRDDEKHGLENTAVRAQG